VLTLISKGEALLCTASKFHEACWIFNRVVHLLLTKYERHSYKRCPLLNYGHFDYTLKADEFIMSKKRKQTRCKILERT